MIPDQLDQSVQGFSVTYWIRPGLLYLVQHSLRKSLPSFKKVDGIRKRIELEFEGDVLYAHVVEFAKHNVAPPAKVTDCPSIEIGIATDDETLFAHVKLMAESADDRLQSLVNLLDWIVSSQRPYREPGAAS